MPPRAAVVQQQSQSQQPQVPSYNDIMASYNPSTNTTCRELTKFELAQVVGLRMEQLARNAPAFVDVGDIMAKRAPTSDKLMMVAMRELEQKRMPFMVARTLPIGTKEYWRVADMVVPNIIPFA